MFRRPTLFLALLCCAQGLLATDRTYELLIAPHVRDKIRIQLSADRKGIEYQKDQETRFAELAEGKAFALHDQADIVFRDFNPFLYSISTSQKTEPDPNFGSIVKFLDAAQGVGVNLSGLRSSAANTKSLLRGFMAGRPEDDEESWCPDLKGITDKECRNLARFKCLLRKAKELVEAPLISQDDFNSWKSLAVSAAGVRDSRQEIDGAVNDLATVISDLTQVISDVTTTRKSLPFKDCSGVCNTACLADCGAPPPAACAEKCTNKCAGGDLEIALLYTDFLQTGESKLKAIRELKAALEDLSVKLRPYESPAAWREDRPSDYIVAKPQGDPDNVILLTVTVKDRNFVVDNGSLKVEEKVATAATFRLRKYSALVPEIGAGMLYSDLKYPRYGTEQKDGKTLVKQIEDENADLGAAVVLNMYTRLGFDSFVYPGFQLGVTNTKDFPGFLFGLQARFTRPRALSISGGALVTWYKDLDKLKPGEEISGTAALEEDLKLKRAPTSIYFGIQYNF